MIKITETATDITVEIGPEHSNREVVTALHNHKTEWHNKIWLFAGEIHHEKLGKSITYKRG